MHSRNSFKILLLCAGDIEPNPGPSNPIDSVLTIYHQNIRSLRNKIDSIIHIVEDYDIVFFTETHLDENVGSDALKIPGFNFPIRKDRNCHGGGIIAYMKNYLICKRRADLEDDNVECMWFELKTKKSNNLICIVYRSERESHADFWYLLDRSIKRAHDESNHIIVLGDLNKNFLRELPTNVRDCILLNGLSNVISKPTHFNANSVSLLDPILITDSISIIDSDTIPFDRQLSDHDGTYLSLDVGFISNKCFKRKVWNYKRANFDLINEKLSTSDWMNLVYNQPNIDLACASFTNHLMNICNDCIPSTFITVRTDDKIWFNSELRREIRKRDRFRTKATSHKTDANVRRYKDQRNHVNNMKKHAKELFHCNINEDLRELKTTNSKLYWKTINMLMKEESPSNDIPPLLNPRDNSLIYDDSAKCDVLNDYFCSVSDVPNSDKPLPDFDERGRHILEDIVIFRHEVIDVLSLLNPNKAVGHDTISNRILINAKDELATPLSMLFNKSLRECAFPSDWKLSNVIPLFKKGDKSLPSNYRPVALLCCMSKVFEKIMYKHVFNHLMRNDSLYKYQSGFLPGHSTVYQLIEMYYSILSPLNDRFITSLIFCDISKAFDRVWIRGLLLKLERYGIKGKTLSWFRSYLSGRRQRVTLKNGNSTIGVLKAGVPQGSVLGPLLFLVFVNDIADDLIGLTRLFADDTSIQHTATDRNTIVNLANLDLDKINSWSREWLVTFNPDKTDIMVFSLRAQHEQFLFNFADQDISSVQRHKHLGVLFSSDGKWTKHIDTLVERASKELNVLRKLKFKLSRECLERIYFSFIRPLLEYACEVWDNCGEVNSMRLERVQYEAARIVSGLTSYANIDSLLKEMGWETLKDRREQKKLMLFYKIVSGVCPDYLENKLPPLVSESMGYNLRNANNYRIPLNRLTLYQNSFFPSTLKLWNELDDDFKTSNSIESFKYKLKLKYEKRKKPPAFYGIGNRYINALHTRLRNGCSALKNDLVRARIIANDICSCGLGAETTAHYFLECDRYREQRRALMSGLTQLGVPVTIHVLLCGNESSDIQTNTNIIKLVHTFIKESGRFDNH